MGTDFVTFTKIDEPEGQGFWMEDWLLELTLRLLALHLPSLNVDGDVMRRMRSHWLDISLAHIPGVVCDDLADFAREPGGTEIIRAGLTALGRTIERLPETITGDVMALVGTEPEYAVGRDGHLHRWQLRDVHTALTALLDGKISDALKDGTMPGTHRL